MQRAKVTAEEFIKIWQQAKSVAEVAEKTGLKIAAARRRASVYRTIYDVMLKKFKSGQRYDWTALQRAAHRYRK
jgi:hypothetical protein